MANWTVNEEGIPWFKGHIYVPHDDELKRKILSLYHDSVMAGRGGQAKRLKLVVCGYYWPSMKAYVNCYVEGCDTCRRNKPSTSQRVGLLKPLPVPTGLTGPW